MSRSRLTLLLCVSIAGFAVSTSPASAGKKNTNCPAAGTEVILVKAMDPAFAADYVDCDVVVSGSFLTNGAAGVFTLVDTKGLVFFQVTAEGVTPTTNPLTGQASGYHVGIDKAGSDVVFGLKAGDKVKIHGGTRVKTHPSVAGYTEVIFVATSVEKSG